MLVDCNIIFLWVPVPGTARQSVSVGPSPIQRLSPAGHGPGNRVPAGLFAPAAGLSAEPPTSPAPKSPPIASCSPAVSAAAHSCPQPGLAAPSALCKQVNNYKLSDIY